jgi:hypothetical protein
MGAFSVPNAFLDVQQNEAADAIARRAAYRHKIATGS